MQHTCLSADNISRWSFLIFDHSISSVIASALFFFLLQGERREGGKRKVKRFFSWREALLFSLMFDFIAKGYDVCLREREGEKNKNERERWKVVSFIHLGIFTNDASSSTHHLGVLTRVAIERRAHHPGHLIVISKTTPHDSAKTVLFDDTPLTRSEKRHSVERVPS